MKDDLERNSATQSERQKNNDKSKKRDQTVIGSHEEIDFSIVYHAEHKDQIDYIVLNVGIYNSLLKYSF